MSRLKVITDMLREEGLEDVARWVENPDAVRTLFRHVYSASSSACEARRSDAPAGQSAACWGDDETPHDPWCPVAAAWRTLGMPEALRDVENAHEEAFAEDARRPAAKRVEAGRMMTEGRATPEDVVRATAQTWRVPAVGDAVWSPIIWSGRRRDDEKHDETP